MKKNKKLLEEYRFPGFRPLAIIKGKFGDNRARIIQLVRRQKKLFVAVAGLFHEVSMTIKPKLLGICLVAMLESIWKLKRDESTV